MVSVKFHKYMIMSLLIQFMLCYKIQNFDFRQNIFIVTQLYKNLKC